MHVHPTLCMQYSTWKKRRRKELSFHLIYLYMLFATVYIFFSFLSAFFYQHCRHRRWKKLKESLNTCVCVGSQPAIHDEWQILWMLKIFIKINFLRKKENNSNRDTEKTSSEKVNRNNFTVKWKTVEKNPTWIDTE